MVVLAILFWLWFLTSVVILIRRAIRRSGERRVRRAATRAALHDEATQPAATTSDDVAETALTDPPMAETALLDPPSPPATTPPAPSPAAAAPGPPEPTRAAPGAPTPSTAPATATASPAAVPAPANVATMARAAIAPVTVAQVIAGIEMPCGLVPLTLSEHDMRYDRGQRAHFFTTQAPAATVLEMLTEELERIGLQVNRLGDAAALAQRGRLAVEIRIDTVGALVKGLASTTYRSAPPNSVVVEFDVVPAA